MAKDDITVEILVDIRDETRKIRDEARKTNQRLERVETQLQGMNTTLQDHGATLRQHTTQLEIIGSTIARSASSRHASTASRPTFRSNRG